VSNNAREALRALIANDPQVLQDLIAEISEADTATEIEPAIFDGTNAGQPRLSKSGQSLKYEAPCYIDGDEEGPKALVVAYLPPEVASESVTFQVMVGGEAATPKVSAKAS
jgi:hypothetical protein